MHHHPYDARSAMTPLEQAFLAAARTAVLATIGPGGRPRLVPICFVAFGRPDAVRLYSPIDEKPKRAADPLALGRVRDILAEPAVRLLIDRWSEDWSELAWLRLDGKADLLVPGEGAVHDEHESAVAALRAKYPQYATHRLEDRPIVRIAIERSRSWGNLERATVETS